MDEISKKDLLAQTGISYGQLYRWKREGLIPEEWFVKRPSFTGQETFFPRDLILTRVAKILEMKDDSSLEEIRLRLSEDSEKVYAELYEKKIAEAAKAAGKAAFKTRDVVLFRVGEKYHYILIGSHGEAAADEGIKELKIINGKEL